MKSTTDEARGENQTEAKNEYEKPAITNFGSVAKLTMGSGTKFADTSAPGKHGHG